MKRAVETIRMSEKKQQGEFLQGVNMLRWSLIFLVVAVVAAVFGFGGIAASAVGIARILFSIFILLFLVSLIYGLSQARIPQPVESLKIAVVAHRHLLNQRTVGSAAAK